MRHSERAIRLRIRTNHRFWARCLSTRHLFRANRDTLPPAQVPRRVTGSPGIRLAWPHVQKGSRRQTRKGSRRLWRTRGLGSPRAPSPVGRSTHYSAADRNGVLAWSSMENQSRSVHPDAWCRLPGGRPAALIHHRAAFGTAEIPLRVVKKMSSPISQSRGRATNCWVFSQGPVMSW